MKFLWKAKIDEFTESIMERYPALLFGIACGILFWWLGMENLRHWMLIHEKTFHCAFLWFGVHVSEWSLIFWLPLFPTGLVLWKPRWRFSGWWFVLIAEAMVIGASSAFGFQNPYVDNVYWDRPLERFLDSWSSAFVAIALLEGALLAYLHHLLRPLRPRIRLSWRSAALPGLAAAVSIGLVWIAWKMFLRY